jgi:hypothetical protein
MKFHALTTFARLLYNTGVGHELELKHQSHFMDEPYFSPFPGIDSIRHMAEFTCGIGMLAWLHQVAERFDVGVNLESAAYLLYGYGTLTARAAGTRQLNATRYTLPTECSKRP